MSEGALDGNCQREQISTETARLALQHDLVVGTFGIILPQDFDTTRRYLHILDVGTANGHWLHEVSKILSERDTATLIGTDIAPCPETEETVIVHDFRTPFSAAWKGTFDLVQLRAVLANVPTNEAVDLVRRSVELLKWHGYIQLVDGYMPANHTVPEDKPHDKLWKVAGQFLARAGLDATHGTRVAKILAEASGSDIGEQSTTIGMTRFGKGASREEEKTGWSWLKCRDTVVAYGSVRVPKRPMSTDDFKKLCLEFFVKADKEGFDLPCFAAWGRKETWPQR